MNRMTERMIGDVLKLEPEIKGLRSPRGQKQAKSIRVDPQAIPAACLLGISAILMTSVSAAVEFDPAFTPHMVLQRDAPLTLGGKGSPGSEITVSLDTVSKSTGVAADGSWSIEFPSAAAGGPHVLKAMDASGETMIDDVLFGDVWLCSGQSNMQMGVHEVIGGEKSMATAATHRDIRILTMPRKGAETPQKQLDAKWQTCSADTMRNFSAVAWFFAFHLKADPALADVPLGIVNSSFGGTAIEAWMPADSLSDIPKEQISGSMFGLPAGSLYNGMIAPLTGLRMKGAVWYQGEANAGRPGIYAKLLESLMGQWRASFHQLELPFIIVQLPSFAGTMGDHDFSWLREAQEAACAKTKNAWLAQTYDTTGGHDLHPVEKEEVGRRVALLARRGVYQSELVASGPAFKDAVIQDGRLRVTLDDRDGLTTRDQNPPAGFAIAGADGEYRYAKATLDGASVILENAVIPSPVTVRHAWGAMPSGNLINRNGLPVAPFRTDTFAPGRILLHALPVAHRIETPDYQLTTGDNGQIASFIVRGKQFLSNEPNGGTRIPDGFGPRNFPATEVLGPRRLKTSDPTGSLEIACADDSMEWILRNDRDNPLEFHIAISPRAKIEFANGTAMVSRDGVKLETAGLDHATDGDAPELVAKILPRSTVTVRLRILP